jgi:hypothetical protein
MASKALTCGVKFPVATLLFVSSILLLSPVHASAQAGNSSQKSQSMACPAVDLNYDFSTDIHAVKEFDAAGAELFRQEKFTELDCIAESLRSSQADGDQGQGFRSCVRCLQAPGRQLGQGYVGFGGFFHFQQEVGG